MCLNLQRVCQPKVSNALQKIRNKPFEIEMQLTFCSIFSPFRSYFKNILRLGFWEQIEFHLKTTYNISFLFWEPFWFNQILRTNSTWLNHNENILNSKNFVLILGKFSTHMRTSEFHLLTLFSWNLIYTQRKSKTIPLDRTRSEHLYTV